RDRALRPFPARRSSGLGAKALALAYRDGIGVQRDNRLYQLWLGRAAELGHAGAQEAVARNRAAAEATRQNVLRALVLLGLVLGRSEEHASELQSRENLV